MSSYQHFIIIIVSIVIGYNAIQGLNTDADISIESIDNSDISSDNLDESNIHHIKSKLKSRFLVLVSLLDGSVCALNAEGNLQWTLQTGNDSLVSASITDVIVTKNGAEARLVPSLDGSLYQLDDGGGVEPFPMDADALLSSSFRMSEDATIVGGKFTQRYGVNVANGNLHYVCSIHGCQTFSETNVDGILSIQRHTKTIRAIEIATGHERWNFSVSEHTLTYNKASKGSSCQRQNSEIIIDDEDIIMETEENDNRQDYKQLNKEQIKVMVSKGILFATSEDSKHLIWKHLFNVSIANAWILKEGVITNLNLFEADHMSLRNCNANNCQQRKPLIYLGQHENQIYVLPSDTLKKEVKSVMNYASMLHIQMPQLHWTPLSLKKQNQTPLIEVEKDEAKEEDEIYEENSSESGYFLYSDDKDSSGVVFHISMTETTKEKTLRNWWKEVVTLSIMMTVIIHMVIQKVIVYKEFFSSDWSEEENKKKETANNTSTESIPIIPIMKSHPNFSSRFCSDFMVTKCLGKGGFGTVFGVKNKMDDSLYAIKRVSLKNSETERSKVIREVKALAKLSHPGIVRYHQSWFESVPLGWMEAFDEGLREAGIVGLNYDTSSLTYTTTNASVALSNDGLDLPKRDLYENDYDEDVMNCQSFKRSRRETLCADDSGCNSVNRDFEDADWPDYESNCSWPSDWGSNKEEGGCNSSGTDSCSSCSCSYSEGGNTNRPLQYLHNDSSDGIVFADGDSQCSSLSSLHRSQSKKRRRKHCELLGHGDNSQEDVEEEEEEEGLLLYIQMQMCQQRSLKEWLGDNTGFRSPNLIYDIFDQLVIAVEYVHKNGLMHRDLKPSNIFFSYDGSVKIGDFGLATAFVDIPEIDLEALSSSQALDDQVFTDCVGTKLYMSPELTNGLNYTYKVDIFAMGMIFFELFNPFQTDMERVRTLSEVKLTHLPDEFTTNLKNESAFLKPMISELPEDRPNTSQIRQHPLLARFEKQRRAMSRLRIRTSTESSS